MKKRIEFFNEIKGIADLFPIIEAKDYKPNWVKKVREDYVQKKGKADVHLYRCPGIFEVLNYGYIVRSWCDFTIDVDPEVAETGEFSGRIPSFGRLTNKPVSGRPMEKIIEGQPEEVMKFIPRPKGTLKNVIKIVTCWHIVAPKNLKFLFLPLPYPDSFEFSHAPGILDPSINAEINLQLFWNITGSFLVKAGTPLGHIIPLTSEKYDFICRDMNITDKNWLDKFQYFKSFSFNRIRPVRNKLKEIYEKHFKLK
tara:strand:- start:45 stop:806 length:762 start_codon:yes stop_codon:yes gene_type:complete